VLPVIGLMIVGVGVLGVGTLADLALVQLVGILAGALSSLLLATPLLVDLKMRDRRFQEQAARVATRRGRAAAAAEAPAVEDVPGTEPDMADDEQLARELRRERAVAAAASTPARHAKTAQAGRSRPAGKASRPTGKRHR
jgi:preprotein translocase subunit SecF